MLTGSREILGEERIRAKAQSHKDAIVLISSVADRARSASRINKEDA